MRNPIKKFFYVPKYGKVSETTLMRHVMLTALTITLCLASMGLTAYAYYISSVASAGQAIQSTAYYCDIDVAGQKYERVAGGSYIEFTLAPGTYEIKAERLSDGAQTGFLILEVDGVKYHTQQIGWDGEKYVDTRTFDLELLTEKTVRLMPHWGTSSYYAGYDKQVDNSLYITDGVGVTVQVTEPEETQPTEPSAPTDESTEPTEQPTEETTAPTDEATEPTEQPTEEPTAPTDEPTEPTEQPSEPAEGERYTVQAGDSLWSICQLYDIPTPDGMREWDVLRIYNNLPDSDIEAGDVLLIPPADYQVPTPPATEPEETEPETEPVATEPATEPEETEPETEPVVTEPPTEPVATEPPTEPVATEPPTEPATEPA